MLPMHLRHGRWYCLGHCSDIEQKWRAICSSKSLPLVCLQSLRKFNFVGMLAVELCDGFSCRRRMFSFV